MKLAPGMVLPSCVATPRGEKMYGSTGSSGSRKYAGHPRFRPNVKAWHPLWRCAFAWRWPLFAMLPGQCQVTSCRTPSCSCVKISTELISLVFFKPGFCFPTQDSRLGGIYWKSWACPCLLRCSSSHPSTLENLTPSSLYIPVFPCGIGTRLLMSSESRFWH